MVRLLLNVFSLSMNCLLWATVVSAKPHHGTACLNRPTELQEERESAVVRKQLLQSRKQKQVRTSSRPPLGLALSGGGQAALCISTAANAAFGKLGLLNDVTHVGGNSGGTWAMSLLIASPSVYAELTKDDVDIAKITKEFFQNYHGSLEAKRHEVSGPDFLKGAEASKQAASWLADLGGAIDLGAASFWASTLSGLSFYIMDWETWIRQSLEGYFGNDFGKKTATFNSPSTTLQLTDFGRRVKAVWTIGVPPDTWTRSKLKECIPWFEWIWPWGPWRTVHHCWDHGPYVNRVIQRPRSSREDGAWAAVEDLFNRRAVTPISFVKPVTGRAEWVTSTQIDHFDLEFSEDLNKQHASNQPVGRMKLHSDPSIELLIAESSSALGFMSSPSMTLSLFENTMAFAPEFLKPFISWNHASAIWSLKDLIFGIARGSGTRTDGQNTNEGSEGTDWEVPRFVDGAYADNTGMAFMLSQMQIDYPNSNNLRLIAVDNFDALHTLFAGDLEPSMVTDAWPGQASPSAAFGYNTWGAVPQIFTEFFPETGWIDISTQGDNKAPSKIWLGDVTTVENKMYNVKAGSRVRLLMVIASKSIEAAIPIEWAKLAEKIEPYVQGSVEVFQGLMDVGSLVKRVRDEPLSSQPEVNLKTAIADWWQSFDSLGWSSVDGFIQQLYRSNCNDLSCIEEASFIEWSPSQMVCQEVDWSKSLDSRGWSLCPALHAIQGFYRGWGNRVSDLEAAKCCHPNKAKIGTCREERRFHHSFDNAGWSGCRQNEVLSGLYKGGCNDLSCIENIKCCSLELPP